jgi:fucose permease
MTTSLRTFKTSNQFIRDRFTWLAYLQLAYFAYMQAALGPLMPFLRAELAFSYTVAGLHMSTFAGGMVLSGLTGDKFTTRLSRHAVLWGGALGMSLGGIGLGLSKLVVLTITSTFVMGWLGTLVLVTVQATLSDRHGEQRTTALTESNLAAAITAAMAPVMVGLSQRVGVGWQGAMYFGAACLALLALLFFRVPLPQPTPESPDDPRPAKRLPAAYWGFWGVVFMVVSVEWSVIFWGSDFLETQVGLSRVNAATTMSVFFAAMVVGRFLGTRLTHRFTGETLLLLALGITSLGFPLFWLSPWAWVNIAGLFITGLGVANLFPLTLSVAVGVAAQLADVASARISMAIGLAILTAPLVLGWLADQVGIYGAYTVVPLLLIGAIVVTLTARHLAMTMTRPAA